MVTVQSHRRVVGLALTRSVQAPGIESVRHAVGTVEAAETARLRRIVGECSCFDPSHYAGQHDVEGLQDLR